jgi:hypothetical protein
LVIAVRFIIQAVYQITWVFILQADILLQYAKACVGGILYYNSVTSESGNVLQIANIAYCFPAQQSLGGVKENDILLLILESHVISKNA